MCEDKNKTLDIHIHGLESVGEAANTAVKGAVSFLNKICGPFAEEYGLYLQDKVRNWRVNNFAKISQKAESKLEESGGIGKRSAHPRLIAQVFEHGSWIDDDDVQGMWAGLLASSCTESGKDDSNLIFINLLSQLTASETKVLNYACVNTEKKLSEVGWIVPAGKFVISLEELKKISSIDDNHRLDRELDHLHYVGLLSNHGFFGGSTEADLTPTALALHMYVRCQGSLQSPDEFFGLY